MAEYDYIKISASGNPRFVRSQSFSHHHRPRYTPRVRCPENCACVSVEAWNELIERERKTLSDNETLVRENRTLKTDYRAINQENRRLQGSNRDLQAQIGQHYSRDEDTAAKLRRRIVALKAEVDGHSVALHDLKKEKEVGDIRIRELSQTVSAQGVEITQLEDDVVRMHRLHKKDQHDLGVRTEEVRQAWGFVTDLRRQLRKCRDPLSFRRYDLV
ncbi:hypothetical protein E0Z10_g5892 [Xylaria hypoxylon]|uniref:Uncharacterized protein n=1 Tax=Xylaria hypoxylon TaxID=37992 RepID=A0A4Z0YEZ3_9PEZI|nr:hypothetical protein E0Z10_g5892 [Xylaria hypoxylon]